MVVAVVIMLIWGVFSGFGFDKAFDTAYVRIYTMMAVQGVVWILLIQALCAAAIIVYFRKNGRKGNVITTMICPIIAILGQVFAIFLLFQNIDTLAGTISYRRASANESYLQELGGALDHLFNHQTHHRGQAHAVLTGLGAAAPSLDLLQFYREVGFGGVIRLA